MSRLSDSEDLWAAFVKAADLEPASHQAELLALRDQGMRDQASGLWDDPDRAAHQTRRMIEVLALLRRTNTGPSRAKGEKAPKSPKRSKKEANLESINESLLR
jgi:hypothetical protein